MANRATRGPASWSLAVLFSAVVLVAAQIAQAQTADIPGNTHTHSVDPILIAGNPSCTTLDANFLGFKPQPEPPPTGTYDFPGDSENSVSIVSDGTFFDWTSTLGIDAVLVKGGPNADAFVYSPEAFSDTQLHAPINPTNNEPYAISHIEFCYDYELTVTKTAEGEFDRTITWELEKTVAPDAHSGFAGDSFQSTWTVELTKNVVEDNYSVSGSIEITNPSPFDVDFSVSDVIDGSINATVSCPTNTVASGGGTVTCTYTADEDDGIDGTQSSNEAIVASNTPGVGDGSDTAPINFTANVIGDESVTVDDDRDTDGQFPAEPSDSITYDYMETFTCSTNPNDYTNGVDTDNYPNTATATGDNTDLSDSADVDVTCYIPLVSKDATPAWEEFYDWDIFKNVDNTTFVGFVGDSWEFNYDIDVDLTTFDELSFSVSGTITVQNPNPDASLTVGLTDVVNGFNGVITADADCDFDGTDLTIPGGGTATCDYSVDMGDDLDGKQDTEYTNTATATFGGGSFSGTATFKFGDVEPTLADDSEPAEVTATDDNASPGDPGDDHASATITETTQNVITYQQAGMCPTDVNEYLEGVFELTLTNIVEINETEDSDTETVDVTCYIPAKAKVVKTTTEGPEDIGQSPFTFELYDPEGDLVETKTLDTAGNVEFATELETEGMWKIVEVLPDGWVSTTDLTCMFTVSFPGSEGDTLECTFDNDEMGRVDLLKLTNGQLGTMTWSFELFEEDVQIATDSTPPTDVDFGDIDLDPNATHTLCETGIPASWSVRWALDANNNGVFDEGETLPFAGCESQLIGDGLLQVFDPDPSCGGEGAVNDTRCVNFVPSFGATTHFLLDNSRPGGEPRTPGYWKNWNTCTGGNQPQTAAHNGGPTEGWYLLDDLLPTTVGDLVVNDCYDGVSVLDQRALDTGRKMASDAAYTLAMHLLAAKLNLAAGAETCQAAVDAVGDGDALLSAIGFDGTGKYLRPKDADYQYALELAYMLDLYNNGMLCQ